jgi:hypothetical protein
MFGFFGKPSKKEFANLVLAQIKATGGKDGWVFMEDAFEIRRGTNRGFLGNTYAAYCQAKGEMRAKILSNYVSAMAADLDSEISLDEARPNLVTVVRERALFAFTSLLWQLEDSKKHPTQQTETISAWFTKALVIDAPGHMQLVNEEHVQGWHITSDEAFAMGLERLRDCTVPKFSEENGVYRGTWNDDYDSSRILLPRLFDDLPLKGCPVITIPNRLTLLVAGSDDPEAIRRMLVKAEEIVRTIARPHNPAPLVIRDGKIQDFTVEPSSPIFHDVQKAVRMAPLLYYQEQKASLEKLYEKNGKDLFVASYTLTQKDRAYGSVAVWTKGVPTLLPVADEIVFVDSALPKGSNAVAVVKWDDVVACVGDLLLDTKMFPARYYVSKFPTEEQLRLMASKSAGH